MAKKVLVFNVDGESVEGHPIGANQFIRGDIREKTIKINGITTPLETTGELLFDRRVDGVDRPWFILDFENGGRFAKKD